MAEVYSKIFNRADYGSKNIDTAHAVHEWIVATLSNIYDITNMEPVEKYPLINNYAEGTKLYVTEKTFLFVYVVNSSTTASVCLSSGNDTAGVAVDDGGLATFIGISNNSTEGGACIEIIKSKKNDLLIRMYSSSAGNSNKFTGRNIFQYATAAILHCTDVVTETDTVGIMSIEAGSSADARTVHSAVYLVTDDTELLSFASNNNITMPSTTSTSSPNHLIQGGYNSNAKITVMRPICGVSSQCVAKYAYQIIFTPQYLCGNATMNGKNYFFSDAIVLLDE